MMELLFQSLCVTLFITVCYANQYFGCGQATYYTAPNGTIKSHLGYDEGNHYGKNLRCTWTIEAPVGWLVELVAESFDVESYSGCRHDYLILYDGQFTNASQLGRYCGSTFHPISSSGRFLTMMFVSNTQRQHTGFKFYYNFTQTQVYSCHNNDYLCADHRCVPQNYRCDGDDDCADNSDEHHCPPFSCRPGNFPCINEKKCLATRWLCDGNKDCKDGTDELTANCHGGAWKCGQMNYTGSSGVIATPNYPRSYPNSLICKYNIFAPNGTKSISLKFDTNFHIETDVGCAYDYVAVYSDGLTYKHGPFCGDHAPTNFTIPATHAVVEFDSDNSDSYAGFKVFYTANS